MWAGNNWKPSDWVETSLTLARKSWGMMITRPICGHDIWLLMTRLPCGALDPEAGHKSGAKTLPLIHFLHKTKYFPSLQVHARGGTLSDFPSSTLRMTNINQR